MPPAYPRRLDNRRFPPFWTLFRARNSHARCLAFGGSPPILPRENMDKQLAALNGHKGGRAPTLTRELAHEICSTLATSTKPLITLCLEHPHWPCFNHLTEKAETKPWFHVMLQRARERQADLLAQDCMNLEQDLIRNQDRKSMAAVQANKVVMEQRRWYTAKILRRMYGDDPTVQVANVAQVQVSPEKLRDLRKRLERRREAEYGSEAPPQVP